MHLYNTQIEPSVIFDSSQIILDLQIRKRNIFFILWNWQLIPAAPPWSRRSIKFVITIISPSTQCKCLLVRIPNI